MFPQSYPRFRVLHNLKVCGIKYSFYNLNSSNSPQRLEEPLNLDSKTQTRAQPCLHDIVASIGKDPGKNQSQTKREQQKRQDQQKQSK